MCPICKNKCGFVCSTCINCGYNYADKTFHKIQVSTEVLKRLLPEETVYYLIEEHRINKSR